MFLNADIVYDSIPSDLRVSMSGTKVLDLSLHRPELYEGAGKPFESNHLYLVGADRLPRQAHAEKGSVIACMGSSPHLERYRQRCCVIELEQTADFYHMFNVLQQIFDSYDSWEAELNAILADDGDIARMMDCSESIFENPLSAIDENFRVLGMSPLAKESNRRANAIPSSSDGMLHIEAFDQFIGNYDLSMNERDPLVINVLDHTSLTYNLLDGDHYCGCVFVNYERRAYRPSDKPLIEFLGGKTLLAIRQLALNAPEGLGSVRQALQNLVEERPLDAFERDVLNAANAGGPFVCLRLKLSNQLEQLPLGYVRNVVENAFPSCYVFEYHRNSVVAVVDIGALGGDFDAVANGIAPFIGTMEMKAGISPEYDDLVNTKTMFEQANTALDMGILFGAEQSIYLFDDYALDSMTMNAVGDARLELLFPAGLRRLIEHDAVSSTSYIETLQAYLDSNMSVAKTASALYVHRSTLMERLSRIRRELDIDLDDPNARLRLLILLKALQIRGALRSGKPVQ